MCRLCAASEYFNTKLSRGTIDSARAIVEIQGVSYVVIMKSVDFIYTGKSSTCEEECEELLYMQPTCCNYLMFAIKSSHF